MPQFSLTPTGNLLTLLYFDEESGVSIVRLHGNKIAEIDDTSMTIFDGGWQSNTTKSRLNALCTEFCIAGEGVFQKDFKWFVRKFVAESSVTGKVFNVEDFSNGFIFDPQTINNPMQITIEQSIDLMAETLLQQLQIHVITTTSIFPMLSTMSGLHLDSNDPQDGNYEFIYLPHFKHLIITTTLSQAQLDQFKENHALTASGRYGYENS